MRYNLPAGFLALFGLMTFFSPLGRNLNLATFALVLISIWNRNIFGVLVPVFFTLLTLQLVLSGQIDGLQTRQQLTMPLKNTYTTDMRAFLKTYQLMKNGEEFYPAFASGMAGLRNGNFRPDINAWRQPFLFYLWKLLPGGGSGIYYFWEIVIVTDLVCAI